MGSSFRRHRTIGDGGVSDEHMAVRKNKTIANISKHKGAGDYADFYLIYLRRSTDDQKNQQNSLEYQLAHCLRYAKERELRVAQVTIEGFCEDGVVRERHTAYKTNGLKIEQSGRVSFDILRPKFQRLVSYLEQRHFKGVIAYSLDRLTRNDLDKSIVRQMMRGGTVDVRTVIADYDKSSAGDLHFDVDGMFAAHWSRLSSERIRAANAKLLAEGKWPRRAPIGYLDHGPADKPLDPERAPLVRQVLELAATGEWSVSQLGAWARKQGLTNKPWRGKRTSEEILGSDGNADGRPAVSRPVSDKTVEKVLHNPFYAGLLECGDSVRRGNHQPLVTVETFRKIERVLKARNTSIHYINKRFFTYRGLIRCTCGCTYSPYEQKRYVYYKPNCSRPCTQKRPNLSETAIDAMVVDILGRVRLSDAEVAEIEAERPRFLSREAEEREQAAKMRDGKRQRARCDLDYLTENKLMLLRQAVYTVEQYAEEVERLEHKLAELEGRGAEDSAEQKMASVLKLSELVGLAQQSYKYASPEKKHRLFTWMATQLVVDGKNVVNINAKAGFRELLERSSELGAPKFVLSQLNRLDTAVKESMSAMPDDIAA